MARGSRGSIVWHCYRCGNKTSQSCEHPGGKYYVVYLVDGKQRWEPVGRNRKDAERRLTKIFSEIDQGTFALLQPILFKDLAEQWLRNYAETAVKPLTFRGYRMLLENHLIPTFGDLLLTKITPLHVQSFMARCLREKSLSPRTTKSLFVLFRGILKRAEQWGYLQDNPTDTIKPIRTESKEMSFLKPEEIVRLLHASSEPHRTLFLMAVLTGMRRGELLALQWSDIDWHLNVIRVQRSLYWLNKKELAALNGKAGKPWQFSSPKSRHSVRTIAMSPILRAALEHHRLRSVQSPYDLVFCNSRGNPIEGPNMVRRYFLPALKRAGLRRVRFHDLRHTYTTLLIAQGENVKLIQSQLGHASIQTTIDRYGHLLPEPPRQIGQRLDTTVFGPRPELISCLPDQRRQSASEPLLSQNSSR